MVKDTLELVNSGPVRNITLGSKAGTYDQILGFGIPAVCRLDVPTSFFGVELSFGNNAVESCLALDVKDSIASVEVVAQIVVVWVVVRPVVSLSYQLMIVRSIMGQTYALITSGMFNWYSGTSESTIAPAIARQN